VTTRSRARGTGPVILALGMTLGCEDAGRQLAVPPRDAAVESESPSAKIYPAPLQAGVPGDPDAQSGLPAPAGTGGASGKKLVPLVVRKLPTQGPVEPELLVDVDATGYQLDLIVAWPPTQATVNLRGESVRLAPTLAMHLLPETARHPARLRVELSGGTLPLPLGTEFLASADADSWLVVWPDHRSYRVVPALALGTILEEGRVDRVPVVSAEVTLVGSGRWLGRDTRRIEVGNAVGTLTLDLVELPEVGGAGPLACVFFFALLRADARQHCGPGTLPVAARYVWSNDQVLEIGAQRLVPRTDYRTGDFALPPRLGLFKPGELPPPAGRGNLGPADVWTEAQATSTWQVQNHHDVPMYLIIDGVPLARLGPHVEEALRIGPGEHRHAARDFLGQVVESGGTATGMSSGTAGRPETPPRPTVQYGTPPELEVE
jgi:hypothetical protein